MAAFVQTERLSMIYGQGEQAVTAVAGVDVSLHRGEVIGLCGPSGGGKTTLLSLLGCILTPSAGSLVINGTEVTGMNDEQLTLVRREWISFIFQGFNLFPPLTALDNVMLGLKVKGIVGDAARERAERALDVVGLGDRTQFLPRDLSGGQRQRVAIARALAADSPLILADEPTGNLDYCNGRKVMETIRELALHKNMCVVVATHDNRITDLFDRILKMEEGQLCQS